MSGWDDRSTLDPGRTSLALRGLALNGSGWRVAFIADAKRRRERAARWRRWAGSEVARALFVFGVVLPLALAAVYALGALIGR